MVCVKKPLYIRAAFLFRTKQPFLLYRIMMQILKGESNTVVLTLTEKCTLSAPVFLFWLKHISTGKEYTFIAADTSSYPNRYNEFTIAEPADVSLDSTGTYEYKVFEQSSTTNLDITEATTEVESGICNVPGSTPIETTYQPTEVNYEYGG